MISLPVDEAYAFDFLAILEVKFLQSKNPSMKNKVNEYAGYIEKQIGEPKFYEITASQEWKNLVEANTKTFEWVDKAKTDSCKASDVDRSNYERCKARKALQEKFFPGRPITETKTGYEVYDN